jgi:hypothetical protein
MPIRYKQTSANTGKTLGRFDIWESDLRLLNPKSSLEPNAPSPLQGEG